MLKTKSKRQTRISHINTKKTYLNAPRLSASLLGGDKQRPCLPTGREDKKERKGKLWSKEKAPLTLGTLNFSSL